MNQSNADKLEIAIYDLAERQPSEAQRRRILQAAYNAALKAATPPKPKEKK